MDKQSNEMQELDVWLAENVMGWESHITLWKCVMQPVWIDGGYRKIPITNWHPTINIAQAFEVVEKFNYDWSIHKCIHKKHPPYICLIIKGKKVSTFKEWMSDWQLTKEIAICLAAKKAWEPK